MPEPVTERPAAPGLFSRAIGVITAPRATFEKIVNAPRPPFMSALALVALIGMIAMGVFLSTEAGKDAWIDQNIEQQETMMGRPLTDAQLANVERMRPQAVIWGTVPFLFVPVGALIMSAIVFAIFNALMGGTATFRQVMAVVAHSQIVTSLAMLVILPLGYVKGSMSGSTNLAVLFPFLDEGSFVARFLGMVDIFTVWWVAVLSIGLAVLYRRKTSSIAMVLFGIYLVIALGFAGYLSSRGGA